MNLSDSSKSSPEECKYGIPIPCKALVSQLTASAGPDVPNVRGKRTTIFIQDECLKHRFIRSRDASGIFERPERLHAVKLGLAAAISRIEEAVRSVTMSQKFESTSVPVVATEECDLAEALARMAIAPAASDPDPSSPSSPLRTDLVTIRRTTTSISLLKHAAVKYVHGDIDKDVYLENLILWARDSQTNIRKKGTEIPEGIPPLDLYLCPGTIDAIQGAIGAVCEAVDASILATRCLPDSPRTSDDPCERAFVAIRPPGHHCGEDTPSGFCFVNNVAVGAAHAHLKHGIQRIVILDIDLHHGNGTQSIVWQINEETYRQTLDSEQPEEGTPPAKPGPRVFYGSLHDILSFPCEDGKPELVQAASASIHGPHGQYIENIHLQRYDSKEHFWDILYPRYLTLIDCARNFLNEAGGPGEDVIVFISCGFDAGEHEYPSMSRHGRKVPVDFYHRFTREICKLADEYAHGRVVSVLEGGYSDRALTSGAMAHLCGLVDIDVSATGQVYSESSKSSNITDGWVDSMWWDESNLVKLEKAAKPRKSASTRASMESWLVRTVGLLSIFNGGRIRADATPSASTWVVPTSMTLRERKKPFLDGSRGAGLPDSVVSEKNKPSRSVSTSGKQITFPEGTPQVPTDSEGVLELESGRRELDTREVIPPSEADSGRKKLPRVILRVRPPDGG